MQVARWGNGFAVRIPAAVVRALDLKEGDEIDVVAREKRFEIGRSIDRAAIIEDVRRMARPLSPGWKIDFEEGDGRPG